MYYVYVLKSLRDGKFYIGYSFDWQKRLKSHNSGSVKITKDRRPFKLIYLEGYQNQQDATSREKFFKTGWGRTHLKKVLKNYLENSR